MKILGAILAGGRSRRFGSDKAEALLKGKKLLDHVADAIRPQADALVICGREWAGIDHVPDQPAPDIGPLGGLLGALREAITRKCSHVMTAGCDILPVPKNMQALLGKGPAYIEGQPLLAVWPVDLAGMLEAHISNPANRSLMGWTEASSAKIVKFGLPLYNLNTREEFDAFSDRKDIPL